MKDRVKISRQLVITLLYHVFFNIQFGHFANKDGRGANQNESMKVVQTKSNKGANYSLYSLYY